MQNRFEHRGIVWIDLEAPTREEVVQIAAEFGISDMVAEEMLLPTTKPRCELHNAYLYVIMHFPALRHSHKTKEQEVDFVVGKDFIVTVRYETIDPLHKFSKIFEVNSVLDKSPIGEHAGFLLFYMLKKLYQAVEHEVEYVRHDLAHIEEHIFSGHEARMVEAISRSARDLLNLRQTIEPHRDVLISFEGDAKKFFGEDFSPFIKSLSNEYYRVHNHIMRKTEALRELRETNNSLLTTKQNETMRALTIMALFTFPLSLIVAISDAKLPGNPLPGRADGYFILVALMCTAGVAMYWYFKHKHWL